MVDRWGKARGTVGFRPVRKSDSQSVTSVVGVKLAWGESPATWITHWVAFPLSRIIIEETKMKTITAIAGDVSRMHSALMYAATVSAVLVDVGNVPAPITLQDALIVINQAQEVIDAYEAVKDAAVQLITDVVDKQVMALV